MRSTMKGFRPRLEMLEDRWVPATVHDIAGDLLISNQNGPLTVTVSTTTVGQVSVKDNGGTVTYSNVGSLIEITGTNLSDSITFAGNATNYAGNLLISSGNGTDSVTVEPGAVGTTITNGSVTVISTIDNADVLDLDGTIGGSLTYVSTYGHDTVATTGAVTVGGNATLTGVQFLALGTAAADADELTVKGSLSITNISAGFPLDVTGGTAGGTILNVGSVTGPLESLTVTAAGGKDLFTPTGEVSVSGNASINFGQSVALGTALTLPAGSTVGGNLSYYGGNGGDTVTLGTTGSTATDSFAGNVTLNMGNGANTLNLGFAFAVAGNMTIIEGNGSNFAFTIGESTTVTTPGTGPASIAGNLTIVQGNGVNGTVTLDGPPAGVLTYHGGNGTDLVDLEGAAGSVYEVYMTFGTGTNTLTFDGSSAGLTFTGTVAGSGGANTFIQGTDDTLIDISFINFP